MRRARRVLTTAAPRLSKLPNELKSLKEFIQHSSADSSQHGPLYSSPSYPFNNDADTNMFKHRRYFIETYGCQMNVSDSEIVESVLLKHGMERANDISNADTVLINTCSIRENAEDKVWARLYEIRALGRKSGRRTIDELLGSMAERLKTKLLETENLVDVVAGPDSYRDLPRLLSVASNGHSAVNVILSLDETYADIAPVRLSSNNVSAYISIMRGCNNLCSYCIVPYTRGRERSRDIDSILMEVRQLSEKGFKEVTLLGQNVNSYNDISRAPKGNYSIEDFNLTDGFSQKTKRASRLGIRFPELLQQCAGIDAEMRIRFTSPHPKDFPDDLLQVIVDNGNVCNSLHIPAQSGSDAILAAMKRDYTSRAYKQLISNVYNAIPDCAITSDFITGFCGETEEDHQMTLNLIKGVQYSHAFMFAYSQREKTHAASYLNDDVPEQVKARRLIEMTDLFHNEARKRAEKYVDTIQLVLIEGDSKRSSDFFSGRSDYNIKVVFPKVSLRSTYDNEVVLPCIGSYVSVKINSATQRTMLGTPIQRTTLQAFYRM